MFENLNGWEVIVLALLGLFIFGPERLPKVIGDALRTIRNLRDMARNATNDLSREMGTDIRLEDLHPKTFIRKHLLSEEEERELRRPFDDMYQDVRQLSADVNEVGRTAMTPSPRSYDEPASADQATTDQATTDRAAGDRAVGDRAAGDRAAGDQISQTGERPAVQRYDADAT